MSFMHATRPTNLTSIALITLTYDNTYKFQSSSSCNFDSPLITSSVICPSFPDTFTLCHPLKLQTKFHTHSTPQYLNTATNIQILNAHYH